MELNHLTPLGLIQSHSRLEHDFEEHELKYIHAEQLVATYLYKQFRDEKPPEDKQFIFGISKLCCKTCSEFLEQYPDIIVRGHHQKQYERVINLETGEKCSSSSLRAGPTAANRTPFHSPMRAKVRTVGRQACSVSKNLGNMGLFGDSEKGQQERTSLDGPQLDEPPGIVRISSHKKPGQS